MPTQPISDAAFINIGDSFLFIIMRFLNCSAVIELL